MASSLSLRVLPCFLASLLSRFCVIPSVIALVSHSRWNSVSVSVIVSVSISRLITGMVLHLWCMLWLCLIDLLLSCLQAANTIVNGLCVVIIIEIGCCLGRYEHGGTLRRWNCLLAVLFYCYYYYYYYCYEFVQDNLHSIFYIILVLHTSTIKY